MSFEKRTNWLTRNQGKVAMAVAVAAITTWGCKTTVAVAPVVEDQNSVKPGQASGTTAGAQPGGTTEIPAKPPTNVTPGGAAGANGANGTNPGSAGSTGATGANGTVSTDGKPSNVANPGNVTANPGSTNAAAAAPTAPLNPATKNTTPITWNHKAVVVDPAVAAAFPQGYAVVTGRVVNELGQAAANVPVYSDVEKTTTNAEGWYEIKVKAAADAPIRFGANENGYVPFDDFLGVYPNETLRYDTQILSVDGNVTKIDVRTGGIAKSSSLEKVLGSQSVDRPSANNPKTTFGLFQVPDMKGNLSAVYLEIPPNGLVLPDGKTEASVKLTWLNPLPREGKPNGDLYGPLQTYTEWDAGSQSGTKKDAISKFDPVNFADLDLGDAKIAPGAELKVKWVVGPEVLDKYPITMVNGQAFMPCYQYDTGEGWTKPVLATVFKEQGYSWTQYTMRGSNPPPVTP